jgi:hypothetical protein
VTDLPSLILVAIEDTERLVGYRDDDGRTDRDSWHTRSCGYGQGELMEDCDCKVPAAVLCRCAADRAIVEQYRSLADAPPGTYGIAPVRAELFTVLTHLAEGYGVPIEGDET